MTLRTDHAATSVPRAVLLEILELLNEAALNRDSGSPEARRLEDRARELLEHVIDGARNAGPNTAFGQLRAALDDYRDSHRP